MNIFVAPALVQGHRVDRVWRQTTRLRKKSRKGDLRSKAGRPPTRQSCSKEKRTSLIAPTSTICGGCGRNIGGTSGTADSSQIASSRKDGRPRWVLLGGPKVGGTQTSRGGGPRKGLSWSSWSKGRRRERAVDYRATVQEGLRCKINKNNSIVRARPPRNARVTSSSARRKSQARLRIA